MYVDIAKARYGHNDPIKKAFTKDKEFDSVGRNDKLHPVWFYANEHCLKYDDNGVTLTLPVVYSDPDKWCFMKLVSYKQNVPFKGYEDKELVDWCLKCLFQTQKNLADNEFIL